MKKIFIMLSILVFSLSACITLVETNTDNDADISPLIETSGAVTAVLPIATPEAEPTEDVIVQLSFESQPYSDEEGRFELQYPIDWNWGFGEKQSRGYFRQLVSWDISESHSIEFRPADGTYVQITVYAWEPLNDLDTYISHRTPSWESSAFEVVSREDLEVDGNRAVLFILKSPNDDAAVFLFWMELGDRYLELSGMGDLDLLTEIMNTIHVLGAAD
ncbi:MAG: hypothetical protein N2C13_05800 [Chloroflexota bacterium]